MEAENALPPCGCAIGDLCGVGDRGEGVQMWKQKLANVRAAWKSPRWRRSLLIAIGSDALGLALFAVPPAQWVLDGVTAVALLVTIGFSWPLLLALAVELVPVLQLFPAWTLVVVALAAVGSQGEESRQARRPTAGQ